MDLSIIIPCYNDSFHLKENVEEILRVLDSTRWEYEVILVDDKSPDDCGRIISKLIEDLTEHNIYKISHTVNTGRGGAVNDGLRMAKGRVAGFLDIDLEVPAHYIPALTREVLAGNEIAVGWRIYKFRWRILHRIVLSKGYHWLASKVLGVDLLDTESGYKFFRREAILPIIDTIEDCRWFWDTEVMVRSSLAGLKIKFLPVLFLRKPQKPSTVKLVSDTKDYLTNLWKFRKIVNMIRKNKETTLHR